MIFYVQSILQNPMYRCRLFVYTSELETFRVQAVTISHTPDSTQPPAQTNELKTCSHVRQDRDETATIFIAKFRTRQLVVLSCTADEQMNNSSNH